MSIALPGLALQGAQADGQVPQAYSEGEKLCDCPEDEEEIEINFDDLITKTNHRIHRNLLIIRDR